MGSWGYAMALSYNNPKGSQDVTLLTGASGGLGCGIAKELISRGFRNIACHYRSNDEAIRNVLVEADLDPDTHLFQADLTDESSVSLLRTRIEKKLAPVSNLINLAGSSNNAMSWKISLKEFESIFAANVTSTFLSCREFTPEMRKKGYGRIINTSSIVANRGIIGAAHYAGAKAAIAGYSKSLALELANKNISVNTITLGYMNTGIIDQVPSEIQTELINDTPLGRLGSPKDAAECILYLLGDGGSFVTGQVFHINGGLYL